MSTSDKRSVTNLSNTGSLALITDGEIRQSIDEEIDSSVSEEYIAQEMDHDKEPAGEREALSIEGGGGEGHCVSVERGGGGGDSGEGGWE